MVRQSESSPQKEELGSFIRLCLNLVAFCNRIIFNNVVSDAHILQSPRADVPNMICRSQLFHNSRVLYDKFALNFKIIYQYTQLPHIFTLDCQFSFVTYPAFWTWLKATRVWQFFFKPIELLSPKQEFGINFTEQPPPPNALGMLACIDD